MINSSTTPSGGGSRHSSRLLGVASYGYCGSSMGPPSAQLAAFENHGTLLSISACEMRALLARSATLRCLPASLSTQHMRQAAFNQPAARLQCRSSSGSGGGGVAPPDVRELARLAHISVTDQEVCASLTRRSAVSCHVTVPCFQHVHLICCRRMAAALAGRRAMPRALNVCAHVSALPCWSAAGLVIDCCVKL